VSRDLIAGGNVPALAAGGGIDGIDIPSLLPI